MRSHAHSVRGLHVPLEYILFAIQHPRSRPLEWVQCRRQRNGATQSRREHSRIQKERYCR